MESRSIMINKRRTNLFRSGTESQGFWETRDRNPGRDPGKTVWEILSDFPIGGARFQSTFPVNSGEVLDMTIALGDSLVTFKAKVVYVTPSEDRGFEFGVCFIDREHQDRIALNRFIYHFKGPIQR